MTALHRLPLAAALALGLAAAPQAQVDADEPNAPKAAALFAVPTVDIDDRDPGAAPYRARPLAFEAAGSDADADAADDLRGFVFEAAPALERLDDGRDGAAPVAMRALAAADAPLWDGRDPDAPVLASARMAAAYDGPLWDGRPEGSRPAALAADAATPVVAAAPQAAAEAAPEGMTLSLVRPNPARDRAELTFTLEAAAPATVRIFDVRGREVALAFDAPAPGETRQTVQLDVSVFAPGTYVAVLTAAGRSASQTFQVVR